jgi:hypothetical protein
MSKTRNVEGFLDEDGNPLGEKPVEREYPDDVFFEEILRLLDQKLNKAKGPDVVSRGLKKGGYRGITPKLTRDPGAS